MRQARPTEGIRPVSEVDGDDVKTEVAIVRPTKLKESSGELSSFVSLWLDISVVALSTFPVSTV